MVYNKKDFIFHFNKSLNHLKHKKHVNPIQLSKVIFSFHENKTYKALLNECIKLFPKLDDYYKIIMEIFMYYIAFIIAKNSKNHEFKIYMISCIEDAWEESLSYLNVK